MKATDDPLLCMVMVALFGLLLLLRVRFRNASRRAETVALSTGLGNLTGMAIDGDDNLYIAESVRLDRISKAGAGAIALDDAGRVFIS